MQSSWNVKTVARTPPHKYESIMLTHTLGRYCQVVGDLATDQRRFSAGRQDTFHSAFYSIPHGSEGSFLNCFSLEHCLLREGNGLNVVDANDQVYCEILPTLGEQLFQTGDIFVVIPSRVGDLSLDGEAVCFHIDRLSQVGAVPVEWHMSR